VERSLIKVQKLVGNNLKVENFVLMNVKEIREKVYSQCRNEAEKRLLEHLFRLEDEEALKWVKARDDEVPDNQWTFKQRFKHFFNITKEDLKNE